MLCKSSSIQEMHYVLTYLVSTTTIDYISFISSSQFSTIIYTTFSLGISFSYKFCDWYQMHIDDILKKRREEQKKAKKEGNKQRQAVKSNTGKNKTPTTTQKSVGANKAKRGAKVNARRGLTTTQKATSMEVEKEIGRQQRTGKGTNKGGRTPKKQRIESSGKSTADRKMKAKNTAATKQTNTKQQGQKVTPPPQKAVKAALSAMKEVGYNVPKGMKMVVSFVAGKNENQNKGPSPKKTGNQQRDKGKQQNQNQGKSNNNNNNRRRGRR